ncbi:hypothetical protein CDV55_108872 [Aspergillus turcosus]|uniref:Uncharacterized protein n=1 Tax=Aspergillus turcosus TaxID=1245748 RepID=A0A229Z6C7_9EURO|nr:hypothetical protein CDV55_108872 [Aspergillus turcosus]RLL96305.1 hypothetical protein CFD26_103861 [Aspergillus turcosus]
MAAPAGLLHVMDITAGPCEGTNAPIKGNVFDSVDSPFLEDSSPGATFPVDSSDLSAYTSAMGRTCVANSLVNSGELPVANESVLSSWPEGEGDITVMDASKVASHAVAYAGVSKLGVANSNSISNFECNSIILGLGLERWHPGPSVHLGCYPQCFRRASSGYMVLENKSSGRLQCQLVLLPEFCAASFLS